MDKNELLLRQQLVAAMREGNLQKVEQINDAVMWQCIGVLETAVNEQQSTHEKIGTKPVFVLN